MKRPHTCGRFALDTGSRRCLRSESRGDPPLLGQVHFAQEGLVAWIAFEVLKQPGALHVIEIVVPRHECPFQPFECGAFCARKAYTSATKNAEIAAVLRCQGTQKVAETRETDDELVPKIRLEKFAGALHRFPDDG